jgi:hypothetical protein
MCSCLRVSQIVVSRFKSSIDNPGAEVKAATSTIFTAESEPSAKIQNIDQNSIIFQIPIYEISYI